MDIGNLAILAGVVIAVIGIGAFLWVRRDSATPADAHGAFLDPDSIRRFSWEEFQVLVSQSFVADGYIVRPNSGGVDFILERNDEKFLVQCKHWKARRLSAKEVRELYGLIAATGATGGYLITSGVFAADAFQYASGKRIELVDGQRLVQLLEEAQRDEDITASPADRAGSDDVDLDATMYDEVITQPKRVILCPRCGRSMSRREEKGDNGKPRAFYGCSNYPTCRGRREIA